jgi:hypothetical protein
MKPQVTQINRKSHRTNQEKSQPQEDKEHRLTGFGLPSGSALEIIVSHNALPLSFFQEIAQFIIRPSAAAYRLNFGQPRPKKGV